MVCDIVRDTAFLALPSAAATAEDVWIGTDLLQTLAAHKDGCVGMAANMIGHRKRIIAFEEEGGYTLMFNPEIIRHTEPYNTEEGCLSLEGVRPTRRWRSIKVRFQNERMQTRLKTYTGWVAQIIQHEIDHCNGIII